MIQNALLRRYRCKAYKALNRSPAPSIMGVVLRSCHLFSAVSRLCWPRTIVGLRHLAICMFPAKIPIIESPTTIEPMQVGPVLKSKVCRTHVLSDRFGDTKSAVFMVESDMANAANRTKSRRDMFGRDAKTVKYTLSQALCTTILQNSLPM